MSTVIKVTSTPRVIHGVAFNLNDMAGQANRYLDDVRAQGEKILADAKREADAIRKKAEQDGRQAAFAAAEKILDDKVGKKLESLLPALAKVVTELQHARLEWLNHWERQAIHTTAAIAGRIVRRQLPQMPEVPLTLVREALELSAGSPHLRIALNPGDFATLRGQVETLVKSLSRAGHAEIVADGQVTLGGCKVETRHGVIDQQFEAQLARIEEELT